MNTRVVWLRSALAHAATAHDDLREAGGDAESITRAMARIDTLLLNDARNQGESRGPGERILTVAPLTVRFEIHEDEQVVVVLTAVYRPRG
ncbi:MAG: hypothetical protein C0501_04110 [Isosphaera sp.]|nr:hypothetical protein [Isosphaera sp.]